METYIGTKVVKATPMSRQEYNDYRGWELPTDENGDDKGYLVEYQDGGKPNHPGHASYISWSPADVFRKAYNASDQLSFGDAIHYLKQGHSLARQGWNGKGVFLFLVPESTFKANRPPLSGIYPEGTEINYHAHIDMKTASGEVVPWLASQTDMLATDWRLVE